MAFRSHIPRTSTMSPVDVAVVGKACMPKLFFQMKALADLPDKSCKDGTVGIVVVDCPFSSLPEFDPHTHKYAFGSHILHTTITCLGRCSLCILWHPARIAQSPTCADILDNAGKLDIACALASGSSQHFLETLHSACAACKLCKRCWVRQLLEYLHRRLQLCSS